MRCGVVALWGAQGLGLRVGILHVHVVVVGLKLGGWSTQFACLAYMSSMAHKPREPLPHNQGIDPFRISAQGKKKNKNRYLPWFMVNSAPWQPYTLNPKPLTKNP